MTTTSRLRRVYRVRETADRRLIERAQAEELAAPEQETAAEAEKRRMDDWLLINYPDGRDPLWRFLEAMGAPESAWLKDQPCRAEELAEKLEAWRAERFGPARTELDDTDE
jgi:hypothetical protein